MSLTGIVSATRAHQADIRRRPEPGRTRPTIYRVIGAFAQDAVLLERGVRVHLPCTSERVYKAALTRLVKRLRRMYPEAVEVAATRECDKPCRICGESVDL